MARQPTIIETIRRTAALPAAPGQVDTDALTLTHGQCREIADALAAREAEVARLRKALERCRAECAGIDIGVMGLVGRITNAALAAPPPGDGIQLRPEVRDFAESMQQLLDKHQDEKGDGWKTDSVDGLVDAVDRAANRLRIVTTFAQVGGELEAELRKATASVGLHAMFVADVMDALAAPPER